MTVITCDSLTQLLDAIARLPEKPEGEVNFFSSGGRGYLEPPTPDLRALFMGGTAQVPCLLSKALLHCLAGRGLIEVSGLERVDWQGVSAEREVAYRADQDEACKCLDLLVEGNSFALGIEKKVYASATSNPFGIYEPLLEARSDNLQILQCVLT